MPLTCYCDEPDNPDWLSWPPNDYTTTPLAARRRKRCSSCGSMIEHGAIAAKFARTRYARTDIEQTIYGDGPDAVKLAPMWLCETCADLFFSLEALGYECVSPDENMRELVNEYAEMSR